MEKKYDTEDYYFALVNMTDNSEINGVKLDDNYYITIVRQVVKDRFINLNNPTIPVAMKDVPYLNCNHTIIHTKPFDDLVDINKYMIRDRKARFLAKKHYNTFLEELCEEYTSPVTRKRIYKENE